MLWSSDEKFFEFCENIYPFLAFASISNARYAGVSCNEQTALTKDSYPISINYIGTSLVLEKDVEVRIYQE